MEIRALFLDLISYAIKLKKSSSHLLVDLIIELVGKLFTVTAQIRSV